MKDRPLMIGLGEVLWDVYPDAARFGGAPANFACHAASLGAESWVVSAVGADELGDRAIQSLRAHGVRTDAIQVDSAHPTGTVQVQRGEGGQVDYVFAMNTAWDHLVWSEEWLGLAASCDVVCFGSLGQRSPDSRAAIRRFVAQTPATAWRVFDVNLRQEFYDAEVIQASLELASVLKLNHDELPIVLRLCGMAEAPPHEALHQLAERFSLRLVALTCGERGSLLWADGVLDKCAAEPVMLVDPVGAGDAFTAALISALWRRVPLPDAHRQASAVAAFVCSQPGATPALPVSFQIFSPSTSISS